METIAMIDGMNHKTSSPDGAATLPSSDPLSSPSSAVTSKESSNTANAEEMNNLKKSLQDAQAISEAREKQIAEVRILIDKYT
jgi:hypothetical protein